ncbi:MAG: NHLP family bacteriocin export ABC transporter peptidase/permease/ATPase subunit [Gammaproteobacteria bacterium]|nr:NHLP family bacteriocin export ABC transporter peptidase/permease/ATPase subunit [Gammaproteobacteria bacterium]
MIIGRNRVRTPTVLQMEAVECGATALSIVLAHFGRWLPIEELRQATGISRDGAKASNIVKAARSYGLRAAGVKQDAEEVLQGPFPCIVFWNFNHFLVVEGRAVDHVYINDPASGPRKIRRSEFDKSYTGIALKMQPGPGFVRGGKPRNIFSALFARTRGSNLALSYIILTGLLLVIPGLLLPAFLKTFIDSVLVLGRTSWILPILIGLALTGLLNSCLLYLQTHYLLRVQTKLAVSSAGQFFWHALRVPVVFYAQRYAGDVASRVQSCHTLAGLLSGPFSMTFVHLLMIVFYLAVMATYSITLTLISIGIVTINFVVLGAVQRKLKDQNSNLLNQEAKMVGTTMAGLQAIETLKATGTEQDFFSSWAGYQTNYINTQQKLGLTSQLLASIPGVVNHINSAVILGMGGFLIIGGHLSIGGLIAFQALMGHFVKPVQSLMGFGAQLQTVKGALDRLNDVESYPIDKLLERDSDNDTVNEPGQPFEADEIKLSGEVELRDVCFTYSPLDPAFIDHFFLKLSPGKRVALVGGSGSGKSTIARLIQGLYQPTSGKILFDGKQISQIPHRVFTHSVAMVDQDITMMEGSLRDNLTMWDHSVPTELLVKACQDACIHDVIASRAGGYDSMVEEGSANFSGGQTQRLEIARALVRKPSILILDEATSALDPVTEKTIDSNIRRNGCTTIIVAHRLSTIRDCDEIIVLELGKVIERGSHDELMSLNGKYTRLVRSQ